MKKKTKISHLKRAKAHVKPNNSLLLIVFIILAVVGVFVYMVLNNQGKKPLAAGRDLLKQPFASNSIWNLPIGNQAQRTPAGIKKAGGAMFVDQNIIIHSPDSPKTTVYFSSDRWDGGTRCNRDNNTNIVGSFPLPGNLIVPGNNSTNGGTPNSSAAILYKDASGKPRYAQNQPIAHCTTGGDWTSGYKSSENNGPGGGEDAALDGPGRGGAQGGSSLSSVGGTIRVGELLPGGKIPHALKYITDPGNMSKTSTIGGTAGYRWPAFRADASFQNDYNGANVQVKMGSLLALPANFDVNSMQTVPGKIMAQAALDYGIYIVDAGGDANTIAAEQGTNGDVEKEFKNAYGYDFGKWGRRGIPWEADMDKILTSLDVITNWDANTYTTVANSNGAQGAGGGAPRVAWAPAPGGTAATPTPQATTQPGLPTPTPTPVVPGPTPTPTPVPPVSQKPPSGVHFLSDLSWKQVGNGWGPVEKDKSNGEKLSGDGKTLTLNAKTYTKGLGVHANSEVTLYTGKACNTFTADVGVDDEITSTNASIVFQVFADGANIYDSGLMNATASSKQISVSITGKDNLRFVVTDSGNGASYDHGDWADAKVYCGTSVPSPITPTPITCTQVDFDKDKKISAIDMTLMANSYGTKLGDAKFKAIYDLNKDNLINMADFQIFATFYAQTC